MLWWHLGTLEHPLKESKLVRVVVIFFKKGKKSPIQSTDWLCKSLVNISYSHWWTVVPILGPIVLQRHVSVCFLASAKMHGISSSLGLATASVKNTVCPKRHFCMQNKLQRSQERKGNPLKCDYKTHREMKWTRSEVNKQQRPAFWILAFM